MKERPIIMGAESMRAILAGTKTQTRRVVQPQWPVANCHPKEHSAQPGMWIAYTDDGRMRNADGDHRCPFGVVGDRLWVREGWATVGVGERFANGRWIEQPVYYRADAVTYARPPSWRSPLFMPRAISRFTLAITAIRVERLRDITGDDAVAEGCDATMQEGIAWQDPDGQTMHTSGPRARFALHWNTLNEKRGYPWQANCWVWVIAFERVGVADGARTA